MTAVRSKLTDAQIEEAKKMAAAGKNWVEIGRRFGVTDMTAHVLCDPEFREKVNARKRRENKRRSELYASSVPSFIRHATGRPAKEDVEARLAEIPADTRDLTAKAFGDPLPGRSAWDKRTTNGFEQVGSIAERVLERIKS